MTNIGEVKPMAVVSASVMWGRAMNQTIRLEACTRPRAIWPFTPETGIQARLPLPITRGNMTRPPKT